MMNDVDYNGEKKCLKPPEEAGGCMCPTGVEIEIAD